MSPITLPADLLLQKIRRGSAYYDKKSVEASTGIKKPKYKLACNNFLNVYYFYVLTKSENSCNRRFRFCIGRDDWERILYGYLQEPRSYADLRKIDVMERGELLAKLCDNSNKFPLAAILRNDKYEELICYCRENKHLSYLPKDTRKSIFSALLAKSEDKIVKESLKKLHLD